LNGSVEKDLIKGTKPNTNNSAMHPYSFDDDIPYFDILVIGWSVVDNERSIEAIDIEFLEALDDPD
jgi:hypothetical protein